MNFWRHVADDRSHEHLKLFNNYSSVRDDLGDVLEVGCGPFTQLATIGKQRQIGSITLQDPLTEVYMHHPNCRYAENVLLELPVKRLNCMLEELPSGAYDTIICINVLEHVMDIELCLANMLKALKDGGQIIFGERHYDDVDLTKLYDVGHPIRAYKVVYDKFKLNFDVVFEGSESYFIGNKN
jgi:2-polyprenyl-3-methyl-5-hydroxy-6-metoxy-1,4-benzoquinol methylase